MPRLYEVIDRIENAGGSKVLYDFGGGLNSTDSNEKLKDNEATIRKNYGQETVGALEKVNGFTKANSSAIASKPIRGLFRVYQSDGTTKVLAMCNGSLYYSDDSAATFTQEGNSTAYTETNFFTGVNYNDDFFFTGVTENLHMYDVSTDTSAATTDQPTDPCKILLKRSDRRLLALNNLVNGSTLYYSKIDPTNSADDWSASNDAGSIAIDGAKSEPLVGGATFGSYDIIFKDRSAFKVWGYPSPQAQKLIGSPGCAAPYSVATGDGLCFFLAHDAIWMYDGTRFVKISDPIQSIVDDIKQTSITQCFGVYRNGLYWLFYTSSSDTTNKDCIVYDAEHSNPYEGKNIWYERDALSMNCPDVWDGTGDANELYAGTSQDTGFVYRLDYSTTGADDAATISGIYQTKYFDMGTPHLIKRFTKVHIRYFSATGTLSCNWYTNRGNTSGSFSIATSTTGTALGTFILGTDTLAEDTDTAVTTRLPDNAVGKDFSLKITHDTTGTKIIIKNVEIEWEALYEA